MTNRIFTQWTLALAALLAAASPADAAGLPPTPIIPVTNVYQGVAVVDNYRWLENFDDPAVKEWSAAQNALSRAYLDALPARSNLVQRLEKLYAQAAASYSGLQSRPGRLFAMKFQPPAQQPWLVTLKSPEDPATERVVLDPNKLNSKGTTTIDFAVPSLDGKEVAVSLSENGSEEGTLFFYDTATGERLADHIPRVQGATAGGSAAWNADGSGVYYTRYPSPGERPEADLSFYQQVYFHRLGAPVAQDHLELGEGLPRISEIALQSREDGRYVLATVANGDGGEFALYLRGSEGPWKQLTRFSDQIKRGEFGKDDALYLLSTRDAPHGKILRLLLADLQLSHASVVVPESTAVIEAFCPSATGLFVQDLAGGPSQIRFVGGAGVARVPLKPVSAVAQMLSPEGDELLFDNISYLDPTSG